MSSRGGRALTRRPESLPPLPTSTRGRSDQRTPFRSRGGGRSPRDIEDQDHTRRSAQPGSVSTPSATARSTMSIIKRLVSPLSGLMTVSGTYDVLCVPVLLPKDVVLGLLPTELRQEEPLLEVPDAVLEKLHLMRGENQHLVVVQLGRQLGTGPAFSPLHFQEAKIEIPYVRHPDCPDRNRAFSFKQFVVFDSRMLSTAARLQAGLKATTTSFSPSNSPAGFEDSAATISYSAQAYVDCEASLTMAEDASDEGAQAAKMLSEMPWFGDKTGRFAATRFEFDSAPARRYDVRLTLHLSSLRRDEAETDVEPLERESVGYRSKSHFTTHEFDVRGL
ncbi:unnamed protein product [Parajaminaea phylloscopi]